MKRFKWAVSAVVCIVAMSQGSARANDFRARCGSDHMVPGQQVGRNEWAHKCGYVSRASANLNNEEGNYATFLEGVAPLDVNAPCVSGWHFVGYCAAEGCYTPSQRVWFGGSGYLPIKEAAMSRVEAVSAMAEHWLPGDDLALVDERIGSFVVGDHFDGILVLTTAEGKRLEVTDQHPLVEGQGRVIKALQVEAGATQLLTVDGPEAVVSVKQVPYSGQVWNLEPESTRTRANLHLAEGFVTGSVRYQNEWLNDRQRRSLREEVSVSAF